MEYVASTPYTCKDIRVNTIFKDTITGRQLVYGEILDGSTGDISQYYSEPAKIWLDRINRLNDEKRKRGELPFIYSETITLAEARYARFVTSYFKHLMYKDTLPTHTVLPMSWLTYAYANGYQSSKSGYLGHCMYIRINDVDVCLPTPGYTNYYNPDDAKGIPRAKRFLSETITLTMHLNASH